VAARDEVVGADHIEAHCVLVAIRNTAGVTVPDDEEAGMGCGVERTIRRVDPKAVDMDQSGVGIDRHRGRGAGSATAGDNQGDQ
jgi:hypothetical protein